MQKSSRGSGCEGSEEPRDPVGIASWFIEARGGFEPIERIIGRKFVPFDRARMAIRDFDREFAGDRETGRFDAGKWA